MSIRGFKTIRCSQKLAFSVAIFLFVFILMGCATTSIQDSDISTPQFYTVFFDQGDHLEKLIAANEFENAAELYIEHKEFFIKKWDEYEENLKIVANHLNQKQEPILQKSIDDIDLILWPVQDTEWQKIREQLDSANETANNYNDYGMLLEPTFRSPLANSLKAKSDTIYTHILEDTSALFASYNHFGEQSFFDVYPAKLDPVEFVRDNFHTIRASLATATTENLKRFLTLYPKGKVIDVGFKQEISNFYANAFLRGTRGSATAPDLKNILNALSEAEKAVGIAPNRIDLKIDVVEVTSKTLLENEQIEFPAKVGIDLPFGYKTSELENALSEAADSNHVIVFDQTAGFVKRRIKKREKIDSHYLSGYREVPNPDFKSAVIAVREAERGLASAQYQYCAPNNPYCELGKSITVGVWRRQLRAANQLYISTPEYIQKEIHTKYQFSASTVEVTRTMSVNYYILDRLNRKYFKSVFDVSENKSFRIVYNLKKEDINRSYYFSKYDTDEDVVEFEEAPIAVKLSDLLEHYVANTDKIKNISNEKHLRAEMLQDKSIALAKYKKQKYEARPLNDPRFDSVVVIDNPAGSLGTGFYIEPNLVLTNYHVVEGSKFVELRLYNGVETFGKVVKSDVRLDLALIKVEARGTPAKFYDSNVIELGAEVEAIGHPSGLDFSITRGIVSAIRKQKSVYDVGGKEILFIQTDTPINPGNSGGPLFLKNKVVGVNSQKLVAEIVEGLGFAIHFSEVLSFLREDF